MTGSGLGHASQLYLPIEVTWSFKSTPMPRSAADILMSLVGATWASRTRVTRICRSLFSTAPRESGLCGGRTQTACPASRLGPRRPPPASLPPTGSSPGLRPGRGRQHLIAALSGSGSHTRRGRRPVLADTPGSVPFFFQRAVASPSPPPPRASARACTRLRPCRRGRQSQRATLPSGEPAEHPSPWSLPSSFHPQARRPVSL